MKKVQSCRPVFAPNLRYPANKQLTISSSYPQHEANFDQFEYNQTKKYANLLFSSWRIELLQNVSHQSGLECVACVHLDNLTSLTEVARPNQVFERTKLYETRKNSA